MGLISKLIQISPKRKKDIDRIAKEKFMSSNQIIRIAIDEYIERHDKKK